LIFTHDTAHKTFRHEMAIEYKANRAPMESDMVDQLSLIMDLENTISQNVIVCPGFEADDIIYSIVFQNYDPEILHNFYIFSGDKDLYQLFVFDNVFFVSFDRDQLSLLDINYFRTKYQLEPYQWVDYKAIVGDGSDNFSGVKGVGKVGATKLLQATKNLYTTFKLLKILDDSTKKLFDPIDYSTENIALEFINNQKNQAILSKVKQQAKELEHSYTLSKLVNFNFKPERLVNGIKIDQLKNFLNHHNFKSLVTLYDKEFSNQLEPDDLFA
jgi:5'-3' exonuclease